MISSEEKEKAAKEKKARQAVDNIHRLTQSIPFACVLMLFEYSISLERDWGTLYRIGIYAGCALAAFFLRVLGDCFAKTMDDPRGDEYEDSQTAWKNCGTTAVIAAIFFVLFLNVFN